MKLLLRIWRQPNARSEGKFVDYQLDDVSPDSSFLEMLDLLNEDLVMKGDEPVAFDHDCREGICGMCSLVINGLPHGPERAITVCQLHMRHYKDGETLIIEPWRAKAFPILKDLIVDRSALDRIIQAGGYISVSTGAAPDANAILVPKPKAEKSMDAAACIGCGACVAACPNSSAMLFTGAKITHLGLLPQGDVERHERVASMVSQMDAEGFGGCTNFAECAAVCPKEIGLDVIALMNRHLIKAAFKGVS